MGLALWAPLRGRVGRLAPALPTLLALAVTSSLGGCTLLITFDPGDLLENTPERCSDGVDNDENGRADCAEPSCQVFDFCQELTEEACLDRVDNDLNGLTDCEDPKCHVWTACNESHQGACTDGVDNNGTGFADCTDFTCAQDPHCCGHVIPLMADDLLSHEGACQVAECLESTSGRLCNAFDAAHWESFGVPAPRVASGGAGFDPNRCEECVSSGSCLPCRDAVLLSVEEVRLLPGLEVGAALRVAAGPLDRAGVALTWQGTVAESGPCASTEPALDRVLGIALETTDASPVAYRVKVVVDGVVEREASWARPEVAAWLRVDPEGFALFYLEEDPDKIPARGAPAWHRSLRPLPAYSSPLRVALHGNGTGPRVTALRVRDGGRCADPVPTPLPGLGVGQVLSAGRLGDAGSPPDPDAWDAEVVSDPAVVHWQGQLHLFYTGRSRPDAPGAIGHAIWGGDAMGFVRTGPSPLLDAQWISQQAGGAVGSELDLSAPAALLREEDGALILYVSVAQRENWEVQRAWIAGALLSSDGAIEPIHRTLPVAPEARPYELLSPKDPLAGPWERGVAQPAVVRRGSSDFVMLYAGRADPSDPFTASIGLAVSEDGIHWQRGNVTDDVHGENQPVLAPPEQSLTQTGISSAALAWDNALEVFRVWYVHRVGASFALHHAVGSPDGRRFLPYPGNPVLRPASATWCDDRYLDGPAILIEPTGLLQLFYHGRSETHGHSICHAANRFGH